jgi:hypothetical protein
MGKTLLITESQKKQIILESIDNEIKDVVSKNESLVKKILSNVSKQIDFDLKIFATFSTSIGGLMGPLEQLIKGELPDLDTMSIHLVLAGVIVQYVLDNKEPLKRIINKIKDLGLYSLYKKVLEKSEILKDSFLSFIESLGVSIQKTSNIMGYTFLIPLLPIIYNLITKSNLDEDSLSEMMKRIVGFIGMNFGGVSLNEILKLIVKRFRNKD